MGNYPVTRSLPEYEIDNLCFEQPKLGGWIAWTNKGAAKNEIFSIVENGANGTAHCLKVDVSQLTTENDGDFADLFPRDAWACNAHIEAGKTYELSYWVNGEGWAGDNVDSKRATPTTQIINWLEDSMTVEGTDLAAGAMWIQSSLVRHLQQNLIRCFMKSGILRRASERCLTDGQIIRFSSPLQKTCITFILISAFIPVSLLPFTSTK